MQTSLLAFTAVILIVGLAGCAAPRFQTTVRMIPPIDAEGLACIKECETGLSACQADCQARYQACAQAVEPQMEALYAEALKQYELELRQYAAALRRYETQLRFEWLHGYPYYPYYPYWWNPWPVPVFPPPYRGPVMPTRDSVRAQWIKSNCRDDCGCLPAYDACFVSCGGQRVSETLCIGNCPPAKQLPHAAD